MKIKRDKYLKARGGTYKIYEILCEGCGKRLYRYQKDGKGHIYRLYIDRIIGKKEQQDVVADKKLITCSCGKMIGYKYVYRKETRAAIKLFAGSIKNKTII
jgi:hypothetical protein